MTEADIRSAIRSGKAERQIDAAVEAGDLGLRGIVLVDDLLQLFAESTNVDVRFEAASALERISRDAGLGPATTHVVPALIAILKDPREVTGVKVQICGALSKCVYDVFSNKLEMLNEVEDAMVDLTPNVTDPFEQAVLNEAMEQLAALFHEERVSNK